jgi:hypothetical protein
MARNPIVDRVYDIVIAWICQLLAQICDSSRLTILFVTIKIRSSPAMS